MWQKLSKHKNLIILILFSVIFLFWQLGRNRLIEWDEGIYALVAKNILATGDWLTFAWQRGSPWFEKPPLYMWLTAPLIKILGTTSLAPRIWSALFGLGSIITTYFLGKKLFGERVGLMAGLVLASTTGFLYYSRLAMLDVPVTFFVTLALLFFWWGRETGNSKYWILFGIASALGVMTKGVIGVFPLAIAAIFALIEIILDKNFRRYSFKNLFSCFLVFLLSALPWHLVMYFKHGQAFLENYILYHVLLRSSSAIEGKSAPTFWFVTVIRTQFRIWFIPLLPAIPWALWRVLNKNKELIFGQTPMSIGVKNEKRVPREDTPLVAPIPVGAKSQGDTSEAGALIFLTIWATLIFSVFTISKSKLIWYIIPIYPVLSLLVAVFVDRLVGAVKLRAFLLPAIFLIGLGYNSLMWGRILPRDFLAEQVGLIEKKNELDPDSGFLVAGLSYSLAAYYSDGPVGSIQPHAAEGGFEDKGWRFMILPKKTYQEKGLDYLPLTVRAQGEDFYLLERTDL